MRGFEVGDKVLIKSDLKVGESYSGIMWTQGMDTKIKGTVTTITRANPRLNIYCIDTARYIISGDMVFPNG